jgi:quercetin dioxygenase-like cupin family protein
MQQIMLEPVVVRADEDRAPFPLSLGGQHITSKVRGADTGGAFSVLHLVAEPMSGPPMHLHTREDEWFYILKGEMTFQVDGTRFTAGPGTSVFAPRNVPHTWQNCTDEPVEALGLITPAQFEDFFSERASGRGRGEDAAELSGEFGVMFMGPPLARL